MRVLVCGSRDWDDELVVFNVLEGIYWQQRALHGRKVEHVFTVIEGGARGADACANRWIGEFEFPIMHEQYPADWETHGKAAGPIRNEQMVAEGKPDVVWAFKDHFDFNWVDDKVNGHHPDYKPGGTEDMVWRAKVAGIPVYVVSRA